MQYRVNIKTAIAKYPWVYYQSKTPINPVPPITLPEHQVWQLKTSKQAYQVLETSFPQILIRQIISTPASLAPSLTLPCPIIKISCLHKFLKLFR